MDRHRRAAAALSRQQLHNELGRQFPGDVKRGTTGGHVEPRSRRILRRDLYRAPHPAPGSPARPSVWLNVSPGQDKARLPDLFR
jgi:hypothetical protein